MKKHIKKSSASTFIYQIKTKRKIFYSSAIIMVNLFYLFHLLIIFRQTTFTCFFIKRRQIMPCLFHYLYHFIERKSFLNDVLTPSLQHIQSVQHFLQTIDLLQLKPLNTQHQPLPDIPLLLPKWKHYI